MTFFFSNHSVVAAIAMLVITSSCVSDLSSQTAISSETNALSMQKSVPAAYPDGPETAPPFTYITQYKPVLEQSTGIAIDPEKGYVIESFGDGAYFVTEGVYQVFFLDTDEGLILVDAPPTIGDKLLNAAEEIAPGKPITHFIYSHAHIDHIGWASGIKKAFPNIEIIAHEDAAAKLARAVDLARPMPDRIFAGIDQPMILNVGGQELRLNYSGPNHHDGNIEIWHEASRTLVLIDVIFPGWMMWRRVGLAEDIPGTFSLANKINETYDFEHLVAGHVGRTGTQEDVTRQVAFMADVHNAAAAALQSNTSGDDVHAEDLTNPWALFDKFIDNVVIDCVKTLEPKWSDQFSGFDVFIYDQCLAMEQSLRVDGPSLPIKEPAQ